MQLILVIIMAVSLSMDAFSLSLAYGTLNFERKNNILLSIIVGLYHFFMPFFGLKLGDIIIEYIKIEPKIIVLIVLSFIGIEMIIESFKEGERVKKLKFTEMLLFGFAVSIDSFSVGIGLNAVSVSPVICAILFSITSFLFTYLGLMLGKKINNMIGKTATLIGGVVLIILGFIYGL